MGQARRPGMPEEARKIISLVLPFMYFVIIIVAGVLFATGRVVPSLIAGYIWANIKRSRKYKADMPAECTGYARRIEKMASIAMLIAGLSCLLFAAVPVIVVYVFTFVK